MGRKLLSRSLELSSAWPLLCLLTLALLPRLGLLALLDPVRQMPRHDIGYEVGDIAESLAVGAGYLHEDVPSTWMPPVYPYLLAGFFQMFGLRTAGAAQAILIFQTILSALTTIPLFLLGRDVFGLRVGLLAALLWTIYPPAWHLAVTTIWYSTMVAFLLSWGFWALWRMGQDKASGRYIVLAGLLFGLLALTDPWTVVAFFPILLLWRGLKVRAESRQLRRLVATMALGLMVIAPWIANRYDQLDQIVFVESRFGVNFWLGNHAGAEQQGASDGKWAKITAAYPEETVTLLWSLAEPDRSWLLFTYALDDVLALPGQFMTNTIERIVLFWRVDVWGFGPVLLAIMLVSLIGLTVASRRGHQITLFTIMLLSYPIPYYLTVADKYKYRFPLDTIMIVLAAFVASAAFEQVWPSPEAAVMHDKGGQP